MQLYVARHGQTDWNALEIICGRTDWPLNAQGEEQARLLAEQLAVDGACIDLIIASPLLRAQQTALYVAQRLGIPLETDGRLVEQHYGIYEGQNALTPGFLANKHQFACRYPGGESMMQVAARVYAFLEELKARRDLRGVLLVSHGGTCRVLNTYFEDVDNEAFFRWQMENTEVRRYELG
ncbi:MAG: histidine phosphatase family protein [Eubacteriales bacterium]|nr:histidine phosphatase family protein [Eubacteriales bacterium]